VVHHRTWGHDGNAAPGHGRDPVLWGSVSKPITGVTGRFDEAGDAYRRAVADLARVRPHAEPGQRHAYTNANYLALGAIVEAIPTD
jgi:hypothetical protein